MPPAGTRWRDGDAALPLECDQRLMRAARGPAGRVARHGRDLGGWLRPRGGVGVLL